ncbi:hypothetical protein Taro_022517 [Colocasia esculenta]|uniref:Calmodulin-binding domain-containing protein n=1 Tax=Colocasia esculenta TaxID=4460 RepID=A0A843V400_COLES|nr:hypothetical protein [Colocasia esculenta]
MSGPGEERPNVLINRGSMDLWCVGLAENAVLLSFLLGSPPPRPPDSAPFRFSSSSSRCAKQGLGGRSLFHWRVFQKVSCSSSETIECNSPLPSEKIVPLDGFETIKPDTPLERIVLLDDPETIAQKTTPLLETTEIPKYPDTTNKKKKPSGKKEHLSLGPASVEQRTESSKRVSASVKPNVRQKAQSPVKAFISASLPRVSKKEHLSLGPASVEQRTESSKRVSASVKPDVRQKAQSPVKAFISASLPRVSKKDTSFNCKQDVNQEVESALVEPCSISEHVGAKAKKGAQQSQRRMTTAHEGDEDTTPYKLKFRRGKVVNPQSDNNGARRLRFKEGMKLGDAPSGKREIEKRSFRRKQLAGDLNHPDPEAKNVVLRHQDVQDKKDAPDLLNQIIEETASKLVKTRKSKVKALVGAFETVISLRDSKPAASV